MGSELDEVCHTSPAFLREKQYCGLERNCLSLPSLPLPPALLPPSHSPCKCLFLYSILYKTVQYLEVSLPPDEAAGAQL